MCSSVPVYCIQAAPSSWLPPLRALIRLWLRGGANFDLSSRSRSPEYPPRSRK